MAGAGPEGSSEALPGELDFCMPQLALRCVWGTKATFFVRIPATRARKQDGGRKSQVEPKMQGRVCMQQPPPPKTHPASSPTLCWSPQGGPDTAGERMSKPPQRARLDSSTQAWFPTGEHCEPSGLVLPQHTPKVVGGSSSSWLCTRPC